jgi:hypothetical protein
MSNQQVRTRLEKLKAQYPNQVTMIRSANEVDPFMRKVGSNMKNLDMKGPFTNEDPELFSTLENALASGKEVAIQAAGSQQILLLILTPTKAGGCFIATAAYGSPIAPDVIVLSRLRDDVLLQSALGSILVDVYYSFSPPLASIVAHHDSLRRVVRAVLIRSILQLTKIWTRHKDAQSSANPTQTEEGL